MAFVSGIPFIFDNVPSERFNLSMAYVDKSSYSYNSGSSVTFTTDEIKKNPQLIFLTATQLPALSFDIDIISENPMDVFQFTFIKDWLVGSSYEGYKKLILCVEGLSKYYFNAKITANEDLIFGDGYRGFACTVECDASWAWQNPITKNFNNNGKYAFVERFNNISADSNGLKPIVKFQIATGGNDFKIINRSLNNLTFAWEGLTSEEIITCDCQTKIINSSMNLYRLKNFNKNFLVLKKGVNELEFIGFTSLIQFTYQNAIRIGGGWY